MKTIKSIIRHVWGRSPFKENEIMCMAGGYAHTYNIKGLVLLFITLGITIGNASSDIIDEFICMIECVIGVKTISLRIFLGVIVVILLVISVVFRNVYILVFSGITFNIFLGVTGGDQDILIILAVLFIVILVPFSLYDKWRLGYFGDLAVADELYKVGRQQWRIFHGLKSDVGDIIDHIIVCEKGVFCVETITYKKNKNPKIKGDIRIKNDKIYICENGIKTALIDNMITQAQENTNWLIKKINEDCMSNITYPLFPQYSNRCLTNKDCMTIITFPGWCIKEVRNITYPFFPQYCECHFINKYCMPIIIFLGGCVKEVRNETVECNPYYKISVPPKEEGEPKEEEELNEIMVCEPQKISKMLKDIATTPLSDDEFDKICNFLEEATKIKLVDNVV